MVSPREHARGSRIGRLALTTLAFKSDHSKKSLTMTRFTYSPATPRLVRLAASLMLHARSVAKRTGLGVAGSKRKTNLSRASYLSALHMLAIFVSKMGTVVWPQP